MRIALLSAAVIVALAQPAFADLSAEQRAEQEELLAWATTLRYQARTDQALAVCDMILAVDRNCTEALLQRGILLLSANRHDEAHRDFSQVLKRQGRNVLALVGRGHLYHARKDAKAANRDATKALGICNRLISAEKADADTWYARGLAKLLLDDESALQDLIMALDLDPAHMDAHTERAHLYVASGRVQDAIDQLTRAVEERPDYAVGYLSRAHVQYDTGNLLESIADCDRALAINPQYARAWHNRGLVSIELGNYAGAVRDLSRAIEAQPDYASAHVYRAQASAASGNIGAARADWEAAVRLDPKGWAGEAAQEMLNKTQ